MSTLRVLLNAQPSAERDHAWALFDGEEALLRSGHGGESTWPPAAAREAVLAASSVRLVALSLPPMSADRLTAAATYALEDRLAGPADEHHLAVIAQRADGSVLVAIAAREFMAGLSNDFARVLAECAIAPIPAPGHWAWYASAAGGAFVRRTDGSAFATTAPDAEAASELALTLAHAAREGGAPHTIDVAFAADDAQLAAWTTQRGVSFARGTPWRWEQDGAVLAKATDFLQGEFSRTLPVSPRRFKSGMGWALGIAVAAVVVHVAATLGQWAWLRIDGWQNARAIISTAQAIGASDAVEPIAATAAIARTFDRARHRAGMLAPSDAIPLLSRSAPALAALPSGTLKTATYTGGQWLLDLGPLDAPELVRLERGLRALGLATLAAANKSGMRMRVTLAPGEDRP